MFKIIIAFLLAYSYELAAGTDNNSTQEAENIRQKALFVNKEHYQKILKQPDQNKKKKKEMKIYKRKDGSIDTLKTIYEANH
jgi:hypothetical protein